MAAAHARALDEEEFADWRAGRNAVYQLTALTIGARLSVADAGRGFLSAIGCGPWKDRLSRLLSICVLVGWRQRIGS